MPAPLSHTLAALAGALLLLLAPPAGAGTLPRPSGRVVLTITGAIDAANTKKAAEFDLAMLRGLPVTSFETTTIWTKGKQSFTGVALRDLLAAVGAHGATLSAAAVNDYAVQIPVSDAVKGGPIVAYARNGKPMPLRDKGPLWVLYPYDSNGAYRSEVIYSRSIWQLARITVNP